MQAGQLHQDEGTFILLWKLATYPPANISAGAYGFRHV
jgi:hypothetical protein